MDDIDIAVVRTVDDGFVGELADLWYRVSVAGGSVGFGTHVERAEVDPVATRIAAELTAGRTTLIAARRDGHLVGTVRLERGSEPVVRHRALLKLLMVDPDMQRSGLGRRLVDAAVAAALDDGIEQLYLSARSRTGLEEYYPRLGWSEVGRFSGGIRVADGDDRDEVWYFRPVPT